MKDLTGMKQNNGIKVIGLTGGIGSGKSEAAEILAGTYGALLLNMDRIAHELMAEGGVSYRLIVEYFGRDILDDEKNIDRGKLGKEVYQNAEKLRILNSFTHPYVLDYVRNRLKEVKEKSSYPFICVETALPREAELKDFCDEIWYVSTKKQVREERLKSSRNFNRTKFEQVLINQLSEEEYEAASTHILTNNGTLEGLKAQIEKLLNGENRK